MMSGASTAADVQGYREPAQERETKTRTAQARVRTEPYQSRRRSLVSMEPLTRRRGRRMMMRIIARVPGSKVRTLKGIVELQSAY